MSFSKFFLACAVMLLAGQAAFAFTTDDIEFWVGTGENESVMVIDWNDGQFPIAYGYRWDGAVTGADMLRAIAAADPLLFLYEGDDPFVNAGEMPEDGTGGPDSVYGIGYDRDGDGFTLVPGAGDTGSADDADDSYAEGWLTPGNFWGYFVNIDNSEFNFPPPDFDPVPNPNFGTMLGDPYNGGSWGFSGLGFASHQLFDGSFDGWGFQGVTPGQPVPEPASFALIGLGGLALLRRRRPSAEK